MPPTLARSTEARRAAIGTDAPAGGSGWAREEVQYLAGAFGGQLAEVEDEEVGRRQPGHETRTRMTIWGNQQSSGKSYFFALLLTTNQRKGE